MDSQFQDAEFVLLPDGTYGTEAKRDWLEFVSGGMGCWRSTTGKKPSRAKGVKQ